ncbi:hypothetical protein FB45DRAFT_1037822 [Roridomyces roridus]|uniref:Uncharacterized protein n=1 Tax=Roridomyces roridus TaxID=1738132 RepID=A0AAD7B5V2_9AGAR|nr:hypothetical protein FB45DRAFT_1037822 [Roridomyces roridus]
MAAALVDTSRYNSLPSLQVASETYKDKALDDVLKGPIRDTFVKHDVQDFGLYLQHAHHTLRAGEAVVKVAGTAHQMSAKDMQDVRSFGSDIVATTWMTTETDLVPMELDVVSAGTVTPSPSPAFIADLLAVLLANGCMGIFGIDTKASTPWIEKKIGTASVVVPVEDARAPAFNDEYIPVMYTFEKSDPGYVVHGKCNVKGGHKHTSKPVK